MNILHANTAPNLLTQLKEMLGSATRANIVVGHFLMSGSNTVLDKLTCLQSNYNHQSVPALLTVRP